VEQKEEGHSCGRANAEHRTASSVQAAILTIPRLNFVNRLGKDSCLEKTGLERL